MEQGFIVPTIEEFIEGFCFEVCVDQYGKDVEGWYSFKYNDCFLFDIKTLLRNGKVRSKKL